MVREEDHDGNIDLDSGLLILAGLSAPQMAVTPLPWFPPSATFCPPTQSLQVVPSVWWKGPHRAQTGAEGEIPARTAARDEFFPARRQQHPQSWS